MSDLAKLRQDMRDAEAAARAAVEGVRDVGSCCLDAVFLHVGSSSSIPRKSKAVEEIVGCDSYIRSGFWRGYLLSVGAGYGQAARRTVGVETATKFLRERGWDVSTYYQLD